MADLTRTDQKLFPRGGKHPIQMLHIVAHMHGAVAHRLYFCKIEISRIDAVQYMQFFFGQVVLGNADVFCCREIAGEGGQPHKRLICVSPLVNNLRRRVTVCGIVQLVLHHFEKCHGFRASRIIVHAGGIQVKHLPIHNLFRGTDIPDTGEKLFPVVSAAEFF